MIYYKENLTAEELRSMVEFDGGYLKAQVNGRILAKLLLAIPQGEYVSREIASRLEAHIRMNPQILNLCNLEHIYYSLGDPSDGADFGTFIVPLKIYLQRKR